MADVDTVLETAQPALGEVGQADIVVGIATYNQGETIRGVVRAAQGGLSSYAPERRGVIVVADGGSQDATLARAREAGAQLMSVTYRVHAAYPFTVSYDGIPSKGTAVRAILSVAQQLDARACAIVGGNLENLTSQWVEALLDPVLTQQYELVTPWHAKHKYDGLLTSGIVYPLVRAVYGRRVREPIGGEFGYSRRLVDHALGLRAWETDLIRVGVDQWLLTEAVCQGFKIAQASMGAKVHLSLPHLETSSVLAQVLAPLFAGMESRAAFWQRVRGSLPLPAFGPPPLVATSGPPVNVAPLFEGWRLGQQSLPEIWALVLSPAALVELSRLARTPLERFRVRDDLWARIIYDFCLAYRLQRLTRDHLLGALTPLYLGWATSFVLEALELGPREVEDRIERLCLAFEAQKPYLISRWRWPDRFSP